MGTQILAAGKTAATSTEIEIAAGGSVTIAVIGPAGYASSSVNLQYESAEGVWTSVEKLAVNAVKRLDMVGTWRVSRNVSGVDISVYRD